MPKPLVSLRRARPQDCEAINKLLSEANLRTVTPKFFGNDSIAVLATIGTEIVGFIWIGLMSHKTVGYVDHYVVHKDLAGYGVGHALSQKAFKACNAKGVEYIFGVIKHENPDYSKSGVNALKMAMGSDGATYTYVHNTTSKMNEELANGRRRKIS